MHAYVFGAAVSRSAAENNFFEESVAHGLVYATLSFTPLTAMSTNGHTTVLLTTLMSELNYCAWNSRQ